MAWKNINPKYWVIEKENDSIEGVYLGAEKDDDYSKKYTLDTKDGLFYVWGSLVLDLRMKYIQEGSLIKITYLGLKESDKKRKYHDYEVDVWYDDKAQVDINTIDKQINKK